MWMLPYFYRMRPLSGGFRDPKGRFLLDFGFNGLYWDISRQKFLAIQSLNVIMQDWMLDYEGIIIEGDNANIINFLHSLVKKSGGVVVGNGMEEVDFLKEFKHNENTSPNIGILSHDERLMSSAINPLKLLANQMAVSLGEALSFPNGFNTAASSSSLLYSSSSAESSNNPSSASALCLRDFTSNIPLTGLSCSFAAAMNSLGHVVLSNCSHPSDLLKELDSSFQISAVAFSFAGSYN
ncbi:hypothetical protein IEQ34_005297 [Dendrobium chrysotoxum]|uniref:RNase H type-1 domain-containing protein n=1 Tax=Dendrobium chrysotoxum TaxID=161865 RepID=A0AAV7GUM6_DENCH|nr:hypothetical protein IEQ34_005297 [Dendrobium chrysotoxum]